MFLGLEVLYMLLGRLRHASKVLDDTFSNFYLIPLGLNQNAKRPYINSNRRMLGFHLDVEGHSFTLRYRCLNLNRFFFLLLSLHSFFKYRFLRKQDCKHFWFLFVRAKLSIKQTYVFVLWEIKLKRCKRKKKEYPLWIVMPLAKSFSMIFVLLL